MPPTPLERASAYPRLRYMGSKHRLLPWIYEVLHELPFETAADPFAGGGSVTYLLRSMGKTVAASDFLSFPVVLATAALDDGRAGPLAGEVVERLLAPRPNGRRFIQETFAGVFFTPEDLRTLDRVRGNIDDLADPRLQARALAALIRSCLKKQPRGVFTVSGDLSRYDDGRRDLRLSIADHFPEQAAVYDALAHDDGDGDGRPHSARRADVFEVNPQGIDLVYLDPPYVPRADDNCYMKRYHFLEGLCTHWREGEVMAATRVKKLPKPYTPFSYRRDADDAFDRLFARFANAILVLSYSSNGYPDLNRLVELMQRWKGSVTVHRRPHRYHFGTHERASRSLVDEYLIVGR